MNTAMWNLEIILFICLVALSQAMKTEANFGLHYVICPDVPFRVTLAIYNAHQCDKCSVVSIDKWTYDQYSMELLCVRSVYMDTLCGKRMDISGNPAVRVKTTQSTAYSSSMDCTFTVSGKYKDEDRLMIKFNDMAMSDLCDNDWFVLYDGPNSFSSTIGKDKYCGMTVKVPSTIYTTSGNSLTFYFKSGAEMPIALPYVGFDITLTHYSTGSCHSYESSCADFDDRCIATSLTCTGNNVCGATSVCLGPVDIFSIGVGFIFIVTLVVIAVIAVRRRRQNKKTAQAVTMGTVSRNSLPFVEEGYNQPVPHEFQLPSVPAPGADTK